VDDLWILRERDAAGAALNAGWLRLRTREVAAVVGKTVLARRTGAGHRLLTVVLRGATAVAAGVIRLPGVLLLVLAASVANARKAEEGDNASEHSGQGGPPSVQGLSQGIEVGSVHKGLPRRRGGLRIPDIEVPT